MTKISLLATARSLARFNRRQRRPQTARADDCHQHHVRICQAGDLEQTRFAGKNSRLVIECVPKHIDLSLINQANRFRPNFICSGGQLLCIAFRREPDDLHPLRNIPRDLQRALADGPSRTKNNDTFTIHLDRMNRINKMNRSNQRETCSCFGSRNFLLYSKRSAPKFRSSPSSIPVATR